VKLVVLRVGKGKTRWADDACDDYGRRIGRHLAIEEIVIATAKGEQAMARESEALLARVKDRDRLVVLDPRGVELTTEELATAVSDATRIGAGRLVFAIGGPFGHAPATRARAWREIALSRLVLNHELARVVLYEQLYRATDILWGGRVYHHD
jgi:23S rRNA (pseudouridine1915-N3)-methyltransferase